MRLPYTPDPNPNPTPPEKEIRQRILTRRGSGGLIALDRTLLHSPPVADGWNSFYDAIRTQTSLSADLREIAICRVAVINKAWYEWMHHAPILLDSEGFTKEMLAVIRRSDYTQGKGPLNDKQWVVLRYADAMTRDVKVKQELFVELREVAGFNEKEIVELTATVAGYNCVSRLLVALDVGEMNAKEPE